ncbi:transcriptional regulator [Gluconacetobacter diazotrophicus]|uniref:transcriptional regulator n=1 Tax=Gluconacetobacter diazotrophicus TaxID=33996 RepID=UPI0011A59E24|nr:YdaS family helix-turn-helix protein [Gluconacetobacter diazotrophicus]
MSIVDQAIEAAGGAKALGEACNLSRTSVLFWRRLKGGIPPKHVPTVSRVTGIPREDLRPDLFRREGAA